MLAWTFALSAPSRAAATRSPSFTRSPAVTTGAAGAPTVWLQGSGTPKHGKNRLHLDLVAEGEPAAEVDRLVGLGARPADVGQTGDEGFTVLADPEGNEFCVLHRPPGRP